MSFSSGSCGNCYYLGDGSNGLLIDAGVSLRRLKKILNAENMDFDSFQAVLVTHDHLDHIRSLASYCRKLCKPVYATSVLHDALACHSFTSHDIAACRKVLQEGVTQIGPFAVRSFVVPHDATQTVGYAIEFEGYEFVIMTDIGGLTDEALDYASKADSVVIEANFDVDMLLAGPYTHQLKMRIIQGHGHLSNDKCADAVCRFVHRGLKNIFLCHLSENNNTPQKAYDCVHQALEEACKKMGIDLPALRCLPRQTPSQLFYLSSF